VKLFYKNKNVLVTGGTGLIGTQLVNKLVKLKSRVIVASLDKNIELPKGVKFIRSDLRFFENCLKLTKKIDYVFHLAGIKGSPEMAKKKPYQFMTPMLMFNANMLEASRINKVKRFLYTSSIGVYNPKKIMKEDDVWKTFPSRNDWYAGWTKRIGELNVQACQLFTKKMITIIVRPANVFGPYDNFDTKSAMVIPSLINKFINSKTGAVEVWGDGSNIRDFIFSSEVARAMVLIMFKKPKLPINIGSGKGVSIKKIVEIINEYFGNNHKLSWNKKYSGGDKKRVLDITRLKKLGFKYEINLEKAIYQTINWFKNNRHKKFEKYVAFSKL